MSEDAATTLKGYIDHADWHSLRGWAFDSAAPSEPQWLEVQVDEQAPIAFLANMQRQDLVEAGYGNGNFAFDLRFPISLDARANAASGATALHQFRLRWNDYLDGARARPLQPDARPWVLMVSAELPESHLQLAILRAIQKLGFRVGVLAQRDMSRLGAVAASLEAMEIRVFGAPEYYSAEDVLRRNRNQFRAVILWGTLIAAGYSIVTRMHQAKARILSLLGDVAIERVEPAMLVAAAMLNDHLLTESDEAAAQIAQRLGGKQAVRIDGEMTDEQLGTTLVPLLPRLRISRPSDAPDPA